MSQSLLDFCKINDDPFESDGDTCTHKEWSHSRMSKDHTDVDKIIDSLSSKNIFDSNGDLSGLHNISNGKFPPENVTSYLLSIKETGEKMLKNFVDERLVRKEKSVFDKIPRVKVQNFLFKDKSNTKKEDNELKNVKELVNIQQIIMLLNQRGFAPEYYATFELLDYPKSLADSEGFYKKSVKSSLMEEIETRSNCIVNSFDGATFSNQKIHIFDGMSIIHSLQLNRYRTFGDFGFAFYKYITYFYENPNVVRIHVIFDRYDDLNIKYLESLLRGDNADALEVTIQNAETKVPTNVKSFMSKPMNKLELVRFLCQNVHNYVSLSNTQNLIISGGFSNPEKCFQLVGESMIEIPELESNHLEADTRIFCNAAYNLPSDSDIIIHSVDTDVFILGIHFWDYFKSIGCKGIYFQIRNQKSRILACHVAAEYFSSEVCASLPALHAFTGCDTTSKVGTKKKALDLILTERKYLELLSIYGITALDDNQFNILEKFYLQLMGKMGESVNEARKLIFNRSCGFGINLANIPCTQNSLYQHILRACAQIYIWRSAIYPRYLPLDYTQYGYYISENGGLLPKFITQNALPDMLIKPCNCKKTCRTNACNCKKNGVFCVPLCGCDLDFCENKTTVNFYECEN